MILEFLTLSFVLLNRIPRLSYLMPSPTPSPQQTLAKNDPILEFLFVPTPSATPTPTVVPSVTPTKRPIPTPTPSIEPSATPTPMTTIAPIHAPQNLETFFERYSQEYKIEKNLMKKIAKCESGYNKEARNGIYGGMFQFSESTWRAVRSRMGHDNNPDIRFNPEEAIRTAAFMLAQGQLHAWANCSK